MIRTGNEFREKNKSHTECSKEVYEMEKDKDLLKFLKSEEREEKAKEKKVKEPKAPKEPKVKEPKAPKEPKVKEPKAPKEPKVKEPKAPKEKGGSGIMDKLKSIKLPKINLPKKKTVDEAGEAAAAEETTVKAKGENKFVAFVKKVAYCYVLCAAYLYYCARCGLFLQCVQCIAGKLRGGSRFYH